MSVLRSPPGPVLPLLSPPLCGSSWPLYSSWLNPVLVRAACRCRTNTDHVSGEPFDRIKSGPVVGGHTNRYPSRADTGHTVCPVVPRNTSTPSLNWSVLLFLMWRHICEGAK